MDGDCLATLGRIVTDGEYDPGIGRDFFFGEQCILGDAAREAFIKGNLPELQKHVEALLKQQQSFRAVYAGLDGSTAMQGEDLLQGLGKSILIACSADLALAGEAADHFDRAWSATEPSRAGRTRLAGQSRTGILKAMRGQDRFTQFQEAVGRAPTEGFWAVWDVVSRLGGEVDRTRVSSTAQTPVLLYDEQRRKGTVALLHIELIKAEGGCFYPNPLRLGLTTLTEEFRESMRNVWQWSGLATQGYRGRWALTHYARDPALAISRLTGRSLEAATCCALWAAAGGAPGDPREGIQLDFQAAVSACLEGGSGKGMRLGKVEGIPAKLKAAREAGLAMVLVAGAQPAADLHEHHGALGRTDDPLLAETVGQAYEQLLALHRYTTNYRKHATGNWDNEWVSGTR